RGAGCAGHECRGRPPARARAMISAHLQRFIGGGLGSPLRSLPQESVARAKPALEPEPPLRGGAVSDRLPACHVRGFHVRAPALPAQRILGRGFGRGAKPPSEWMIRAHLPAREERG